MHLHFSRCLLLFFQNLQWKTSSESLVLNVCFFFCPLIRRFHICDIFVIFFYAVQLDLGSGLVIPSFRCSFHLLRVSFCFQDRFNPFSSQAPSYRFRLSSPFRPDIRHQRLYLARFFSPICQQALRRFSASGYQPGCHCCCHSQCH